MNGYIQIDINGEMIGLKFGMPANRWFTELLSSNQDLVNAEGMTNEIGIAYLVYFGYKNNCLVKDQSPVHGFGFFIEWVEEAMIDEGIRDTLVNVSQCYADSKFTKEWVRKTEEATEEIKKKMTGILSNPSVTENSDLQHSSTTA